MTAVIVEDEVLIARELQLKTNSIAPHIRIVAHLDSVHSTIAWLQNNPEPDVWLMDIQLSDGISFQIFQQTLIQAPVIFTTAYDDYAIQAFKANGIDYLLKPIDEDELKTALQKAANYVQRLPINIKQLAAAFQVSLDSAPRYKERLLVSFRNKYVPVEVQQIAVIYKDVVLKLYTTTQQQYTITYESLEELESQLSPHLFFRTNRQCLVNKNVIQSIEPIENQKSLLHLSIPFEQTIVVSREKSTAIRRWLEGH